MLFGPAAAESFCLPVIWKGHAVPGQAERHAWANYMAFSALLVREGVVPRGFAWWEACAGRVAACVGRKPRDVVRETGVGKGAWLDAEVPAAVVWVLVAGEVVWGMRGVREGGNTGFGAEEWEKWRGMFEGMERRGDVAPETKELARDAGVGMGELERL